MRQRSLSTAMTLALFGLPSIAFAQHLQVSPTLPSDEDRVLLVVSGYGCAPGEAEEIETAGEEMSGTSFGTSLRVPFARVLRCSGAARGPQTASPTSGTGVSRPSSTRRTKKGGR